MPDLIGIEIGATTVEGTIAFLEEGQPERFESFRILRSALSGATKADLAAALGVSLSAAPKPTVAARLGAARLLLPPGYRIISESRLLEYIDSLDKIPAE